MTKEMGREKESPQKHRTISKINRGEQVKRADMNAFKSVHLTDRDKKHPSFLL